MPLPLFQTIRSELETGIQLPKCLKCGCMQATLDHLAAVLPIMDAESALAFHNDLTKWAAHMQPVQYSCLGCAHCYPAVAQNLLAGAFPQFAPLSLRCDFQINEDDWPPVVGDYVVVAPAASVAVSTLASVDLVDKIAAHKPSGLAIVGKTETENIGLDKIIKNMITNPALRHLIVCGAESKGHQTGQTLLALAQNGVDAKGRIIKAPGKRPFLRNVVEAEIEQFRHQVQIVNMIGCEDVGEISAQIETLSSCQAAPCGCSHCNEAATPDTSAVETILAADLDEIIKLDKAGYFVILPIPPQGIINVEYYSYNDRLLGVIEGQTARAIYLTILNRGWVTELSHAAYLGKELAKAEMSLEVGFKYIQDGA
ncbi:MAG: DUF4346 domain-containing protein [Anaerolineae bacterium]|nr:DUF4346 domain-containing protein [Anaerolineae bacterium]